MSLSNFFQRRPWLIWLSLIAIAGGSWLLIGRQSHLQRPKIAQLPQHPFIQAYFNHNPASSYLEPYRPLHRPGDDLEAKIIAAIDQAQVSIDIAVQELKLPRIAQALVKKQQAGVRVRVILENIYSRSWSNLTAAEVSQLSSREQERYREFFQLVDIDRNGQLSLEEVSKRDALYILQAAHMPMIDDTADGSAGSGLMHHKFLIIDSYQALVTSANWTMSDIHGDLRRPASRGNHNNLLLIQSFQLAQALETEFDLMWGDGPGGQPNSLFGIQKPRRSPLTIPMGDGQVTIHFSPQAKTHDWQTTSNGLIGQTLSQAHHQADLALFVFSEPQITNVLQGAQQQGVQIRALIDRSFAYRPYSQLLPMLGVESCRQQNTTWTKPLTTAGAPSLPEGDFLHHKFAVLDRQRVITGSHNWSAAGNHQNDETLMVINSSTVAAHFQQEFDQLYQSAKLGIPNRLPKQAIGCAHHQHNASK